MNYQVNYQQLGNVIKTGVRFPCVTVHGRFQPPLHINYWSYIGPAFDIADKVTILITNPDLDEAAVKETDHRSKAENNPFTYEQRVKIFEKFFERMGISSSRYEFRPFNITDDTVWQALDKAVPNMVNTYGPWSQAKLKKFQRLGFQVIHSDKPKATDISGTKIREILKSSMSADEKKAKLIEVGYMAEAIPGLFEVLNEKLL